MTTCPRKAKVPSLDDRIETLNRNAVEASSAEQVFGVVGTAIALIRVSAPLYAHLRILIDDRTRRG